ncbi:MAG: hypothetical protein ACK5ML_11325 [Lachnospiraceae bacterium]
MKKRLLAMLLVGSMCVGVLAGCSNNNSTETKTTESETTDSADLSENLTISAWVHTDDNEDGYLTDTNENPALAFVSEKFNVSFEWQIPPTGSESEQMNLMIGSGDYTDVFDSTFSQQTCQELYEDGVIQDLTSYVEQYMPNYMAYIESNEIAKKSAYTDDDKIVYIPTVSNEPQLNWGGLMYNRQILEDLTEGNVAFPSGEDEPMTVEDWEYMLDLMKQHYEGSGLTDYAALILPANGYLESGDLLTGFGTTGTYYLDDSGKVQHGVLDEGFYNYLVKMNEWYEKGYIYQDFASRSSDPFYFPNTALTYGGAAGVFFGLANQLGGSMSLPEYDMEVNFKALTAPVDAENNAIALPANGMLNTNESVGTFTGGWVVSSACDEEKLIRWLQVCDYLFSEEGSMIKSYGLTKEQAGENEVYKTLGMEDGAYWFDENEEFVYNPVSDPFSADMQVKENQLRIQRLPGISNFTYYNEKSNEESQKANEVWLSNGYSSCLPAGVTLTVEESATNSPLQTAWTDYVNAMVPKFIMGTEELSEESFERFRNQVKSLGMDTTIELYQTAYERYQSK